MLDKRTVEPCSLESITENLELRQRIWERKVDEVSGFRIIGPQASELDND